MDAFTSFFQQVPSEILGFTVSAVIFLITVFLVARKSASVGIAFLFLLFAFITGFTIAYGSRLFSCLEKKKVTETVSLETSALDMASLEILPNQSAPMSLPAPYQGEDYDYQEEPEFEDGAPPELST